MMDNEMREALFKESCEQFVQFYLMRHFTNIRLVYDFSEPGWPEARASVIFSGDDAIWDIPLVTDPGRPNLDAVIDTGNQSYLNVSDWGYYLFCVCRDILAIKEK